MVAVDTTLATNTIYWWSTGVSKGLGNGTSLANRMAIPTGLGSLTLPTSATLYIVLEEATDGWIKLGNGEIAGKGGYFYGYFYTVNSSGVFDTTRTEKVRISGTNAFKDATITLGGIGRLNNLIIGIDDANNKTTTGLTNISTDTNYLYDCHISCSQPGGAGTRVYASPYFDKCLFDTNQSYSCYPMGQGIPTFKDCEFKSATYMFYAASLCKTINIVDSITTAQTRSYINGLFKLQYFKSAYLKTIASGLGIEDTSFSAHNKDGDVADYLPSNGVSDSFGICKTEYRDSNIKSIPCLWKVETHQRTSAGLVTMSAPISSITYANYGFDFYNQYYGNSHLDRSMTSTYGTELVPIEIEMDNRTISSTIRIRGR